MRRSSSGALLILPFLISDSLSTPTTFSPTTIGMPTSAPPMANESQYLAAMKVEPRAPVIIGRRLFVLTLWPNSVVRSTFGKMQSSASVDSPLPRPEAP